MQKIWQKIVKDVCQERIDAKTLAAFNTNVDVVVHLTDSNMAALQSNPRIDLAEVRTLQGDDILEISQPNELLAVLAEALKVGKSHYVVLTDLSLIDWLEEVFVERRESMGGQAGIIANQMASLGARSVVYTSLLSNKQASMFLPGVEVPVVDGGMTIRPVREGARSGDKTKENWIFEYAKNERFEIDGQVIVTPRANRVILATRPEGVIMGFDEQMKEYLPELGREVDVAFLAGFHYAPSEEDLLRAYLDESTTSVRRLKEKNPKLRIHFEYVPMRDRDAEKAMLEAVASEIKSFGINENEIKQVLTLFGYDKEAAEIDADERAFSLYKGCLRIMQELGFERIQLHNLGYYVVLLKKPYALSARQVRDACLYASAVNAAKAKFGGTVTLEQLAVSSEIELSEIGFNQIRGFAAEMRDMGVDVPADFLQEGILERDDHYVLIVPAHVVPNPVSTVGMGDTISSSSFAYQWSPGISR